MNYLRVKWKHTHEQYPELLFSELDEERREVRKVEVFPDGRIGFASAMETSGPTQLGLEPVPPLVTIAEDPEFEPAEISPHEFERVWSQRHGPR